MRITKMNDKYKYSYLKDSEYDCETFKIKSKFRNKLQRFKNSDKDKERGFIIFCSGGSDSMALLDLFLKEKFKVTPLVKIIHIDYGLRYNSGYDLDAIKKYLTDRKISSSVELENHKFDLTNVSNVQNFARKIRLELAYDDDYVNLFAHNADDNAETMMMRFLQCGKPKTIKTVSTYEGKILARPLIEVRKNALHDYCRKHNIPYSLDASNLENKYLRNKIRNIIIPQISQLIGYDVVNSINKGAEK